MKITKIEDFHVDGGWDSYAFLKISTDAGLVGWSEYGERRGRKGLTGLIQTLGAVVIGQDPLELNQVENIMLSFVRTTSGGLNAQAVGAIMNALLDIKAKAAGLSVADLLGGAVREKIPVYWSRCGVVRATQAHLFDGELIEKPAIRRVEDLVGAGKEARERGFKAIKCNLLVFDDKGGRVHSPGSARGLGHPELNVEEYLVEALIAQLSALREGAGKDMRLICDLNFNYKTEGFKRFAKAVEPFHLMWLEMDSFDAKGLSHIRQSSSTPIGSLEAIFGRKALRPYLEERSVDVAIIDAMYNGLPESLRMASMCDAYEINVASHAFAGPLASVMSAHFCAVVPNLRIMEMDVDEAPWRSSLLTNPFTLENGHFIIPKGIGWGTDVDEAMLVRHRSS